MGGSSFTGSILSPGLGGFSITPADSDLGVPTRGLWVGSPGDLRVTMVAGGDVVLKGAVGLIPIAVKRSLAAGHQVTRLTVWWVRLNPFSAKGHLRSSSNGHPQ